MRKTLLVAILVLTAACGSYRFPGEPPIRTGVVAGQVMTFGCGMIGPAQPAQPMCVPPPAAQPNQQPPIDCAPNPSIKNPCGAVPVPGLELDFAYAGGTATVATKTEWNGSYSIELAVGTWTVSTKGFMRILSGPTTITVTAGAGIVANYIVQSIAMESGLPANPPG